MIIMRKASKIIGLVGSVWAFVWSIFGIAFSWRFAWSGYMGEFLLFSLICVCLAIAGIIGGVLTLKRPVVSIVLLFLSSSGLIILLAKSMVFGSEEGWEYLPSFAGYGVGSPLMVVGAILGIISATKSRGT